MSGPNSSSEWSIEGRRLVPLMPRLVPQTAFTVTANAVASATANQNANLLLPAETGNKEGEARNSFILDRGCFETDKTLNNMFRFLSCSGCMLLLHKHHLHLHQRYSDQWHHRSNSKIPTTTQPLIQRGGAAQREHCLREE